MEMSQADIADRLTILELKLDAGMPVHEELARCRRFCQVPIALLNELRAVNTDGWKWVSIITDYYEGRRRIHQCDMDQLSTANHNAHKANKARIAVKNKINRLFRDYEEPKTWAGANDGSGVRTG